MGRSQAERQLPVAATENAAFVFVAETTEATNVSLNGGAGAAIFCSHISQTAVYQNIGSQHIGRLIAS